MRMPSEGGEVAAGTCAGMISPADLEFTGERIVPGKTAESLFREHEERYVFAGQYVARKDVVDVACGAGVGTSYLREAGARHAWGLDIDPGAVAFAKGRYKDCEFAECEATQLCLQSGSADVVVSFETVEHLKEQRKFLVECRRVLRPGGVLICSTPNHAISRWSANNPFHTRELNPAEFHRLLGSIFESVTLFAQDERVYLTLIARRMGLRFLEAMGLRRFIRGLLTRASVTESLRTEFASNVSRPEAKIREYRRNLLTQPTFLIAVARKEPAQG